MEAENVLNLLDSYWYDLDLFKRTKPTKNNEIIEIPLSKNSDLSIQTLPTIYTNSSNNEKLSINSKLSDFSASPNSVLQSPKLQTIFSGKDVREFDDSKSEKLTSNVINNSCDISFKGNLVNSQKRKKKRLSKSLSDLEFEELKGFMDLGFVFSEDDKDSILASIIPGLQRLGKPVNNNSTLITPHYPDNSTSYNNIVTNDFNKNNKVMKPNTHDLSSNTVSRPYLSEAWEVLEKKKKENSALLKWKVPASTNQVDMKDYIKSWAHNVASTVK